MNAPTKRYPEILDDLAAKLAALLVDEGMSPERSTSIGFRFAERVRRDWGGAAIYIPVGAAHDADSAALDVYKRWTGSNLRELARGLGVSERRVRQLYNAGRELARERGELRDDDADPQASLL